MRDAIQAAVEKEGLAFLGVVALDYPESYARYQTWLAESRHAGMEFMTRHEDLRREPARLLPGALNAVIIGLPYYQGDAHEIPTRPTVAQYARLRDYHRVLRDKLETVFDELGGEYRVLVDSAPVLERALAAKSASGFIGKNTCYIHPKRGSFLLLAEVLTTREIVLDRRIVAERGCGECKRCQVHCPTGALDEAYRIDANLCLAYWTIEHRGTIPERFWPWLGKYYFGCDICQLVCPYNFKATGNRAPIEPRVLPDLFETATMDQAGYERWFGGTPMTRAKRGGLRRNALIAMTVTGDRRLPQAMALARADDESPVGDTLAQIHRYLVDPVNALR